MPPLPKKEAERTRKADPKAGPARHLEQKPVKVPPPDKDWHKRAKELYRSLKTSGQADAYQDSDWAYARVLCDYLTQWYNRTSGGAMDAANITSMMQQLGMTEGARRSTLRIELNPPEEELPDAQLVAINGWKDQLLGPKKAANG